MKSLSILLITLLLVTFGNAQSPVKVSVTGSGEPIIFLGGFATNGDAVWQETVGQLSKTHECQVVNYAGFAGNKPIGFPWLPQIIGALESYIVENQLENLILIGHSLGGTLGIKLAANPTLHVSKLLIVDALPATGALITPNFDPENLHYDSPYNNQVLDMNDDSFDQMATNMAAGMTSSDAGKNLLIDWIKATDRKTYVYAYTDYLKFDVRKDLKDINIPMTILGAGKPYGEEMARANFKKQYENLVDYQLFINPDSAHFIMMDQPIWFLEHINMFIN